MRPRLQPLVSSPLSGVLQAEHGMGGGPGVCRSQDKNHKYVTIVSGNVRTVCILIYMQKRSLYLCTECYFMSLSAHGRLEAVLLSCLVRFVTYLVPGS